MRAALLGPRLRRNLYKIPTEEEKAEELMKLAANTKLEGGDSGCDSASLGDDADVSGGVSDASSTPAETLKAKKLIKRKVNSYYLIFKKYYVIVYVTTTLFITVPLRSGLRHRFTMYYVIII